MYNSGKGKTLFSSVIHLLGVFLIPTSGSIFESNFSIFYEIISAMLADVWNKISCPKKIIQSNKTQPKISYFSETILK